MFSEKYESHRIAVPPSVKKPPPFPFCFDKNSNRRDLFAETQTCALLA